jgi:Tfp pilus assembly protein PilN
MMSILGGMLILSVLAWSGGKVFQDRVYVNRLNSELAKLEVELSKIQNIQKELNRIEERIALLDDFYGNDPSALRILEELTDRIPKSAWVQRLDMSKGEVRIDGQASSSTELIALLDQSNIFKNVAFVSSISRIGGGNERFRIKLQIE